MAIARGSAERERLEFVLFAAEDKSVPHIVAHSGGLRSVLAWENLSIWKGHPEE